MNPAHKTCTECGARYAPLSRNQLFCGDACRAEGKRKRDREFGIQKRAGLQGSAPVTDHEAATATMDFVAHIIDAGIYIGDVLARGAAGADERAECAQRLADIDGMIADVRRARRFAGLAASEQEMRLLLAALADLRNASAEWVDKVCALPTVRRRDKKKEML